MGHSNAAAVLPETLLAEIQRYVQGKSLYIPKPEGNRKKWGENTQSKALTRDRNEKIRADFQDGSTIAELTGRYYLSSESIRKIVYCKS